MPFTVSGKDFIGEGRSRKHNNYGTFHTHRDQVIMSKHGHVNIRVMKSILANISQEKRPEVMTFDRFFTIRF